MPSKFPKFSHSFEVVWQLPESLSALKRLASNYRWTWHHETRELFRQIDKERWDASNHNPVSFLYSIGAERLAKLSTDKAFLAKLAECDRDLTEYLESGSWYSSQTDRPENERFAYFCAEFGISEGLPIYSGGLGVLAGDHLKAASDLGIPLVAVGLLYSRGYFRQRLNVDGWQQEVYPEYDFYEMPLTLIRNGDNEPLRIEVEFPDRTVNCQIWRADVGRVQLYLLDSNVLENEPNDQSITDTLYGGDEEMRIRQEMILGIGGIRALRALGISPTVCHMNEGHAAFMAIERIRQFMADRNCDYKTARQVLVNGNVFTTHTPVPAGFDVFSKDLLERYVGKWVAEVGLTMEALLRLGRIDPENQDEPFNMAVLAMENANHVNGVSKLHAQVTRSMFHGRWPDYPENEAPIDAVTNGIHTLTWIGQRSADLYDEYLGPAWRTDAGSPESWAGISQIPDHELWTVRENQRGDLVRFVRKRLQSALERRSGSQSEFNFSGGILDPRILTIGFARRFATYKRATLMLSQRERLLELLNHPERPVQIVIAGKSHPRDDGGKTLIQELVRFMDQEGSRHRMVFVEDYDMQVARALVQGVDVWLNNPRRPMEASGTSGMKVVPNGGLNCSILDGWWDEAFDTEVGFAIGDRDEAADQGQQDWLDSQSLYRLIENEIAPKFYHRPDGGLPTGWIRMMRASIQRLAPTFSTARMVSDYAKQYYLPASTTYSKMAANLQLATDARNWRLRVRSAWGDVRVLNSSCDRSQVNSNEENIIRAEVQLGNLTPDDVEVQALVGKMASNRDLVDYAVTPMRPVGQAEGTIKFEGQVSYAKPGHRGFTVRIVPRHSDVAIPGELNLVRWQ
ncbi:MAG TPA: alpha-glucan family phosphorylase [Fimbriimonadaceae bacterium]|nr:alpha-glucan family phosphorylase [Fimbriimonadaceae bacterium]